ncbi:MAG: hypothetical protein K2K97_07660 [Muribaculaceae bacterium]|nr:hypothetical protein [Muribaculaceae bacterium]
MDDNKSFKLKLFNAGLDRTEANNLLQCLQTCLKEKDGDIEYAIRSCDRWSNSLEIEFDQFPIEVLRLLSAYASPVYKMLENLGFIVYNSDFVVTNDSKIRFFVPYNDRSFSNIEDAIQNLPNDDASDYPVQIIRRLDLGKVHDAIELEASEIWSPYSDCKDFDYMVKGSKNKKDRFQKLIKERQSLIREFRDEQ